MISLTPREPSLISVALGTFGLSHVEPDVTSSLTALTVSSISSGVESLSTSGLIEVILRSLPRAARTAIQLMLIAPEHPLALDPRF